MSPFVLIPNVEASMMVYVEAYARDAVAANALRMSAPQTNRFRFPTAIPFFVVCSSFDCLDFCFFRVLYRSLKRGDFAPDVCECEWYFGVGRHLRTGVVALLDRTTRIRGSL